MGIKALLSKHNTVSISARDIVWMLLFGMFKLYSEWAFLWTFDEWERAG